MFTSLDSVNIQDIVINYLGVGEREPEGERE